MKHKYINSIYNTYGTQKNMGEMYYAKYVLPESSTMERFSYTTKDMLEQFFYISYGLLNLCKDAIVSTMIWVYDSTTQYTIDAADAFLEYFANGQNQHDCPEFQKVMQEALDYGTTVLNIEMVEEYITWDSGIA